MTHLYIELNTGLTEEVNSSIISKLYELAISGDLDNTSDLKGRLHTPVAYSDEILYLNQNFNDLYIAADALYLKFVDPVAMSVCVSKYSSDGVGCTLDDLAAVTELDDSFASNGILYFNEFKYFTSIRSIPTWFVGNETLKSITIPNSVSRIGNDVLIGGGFRGCTALLSIIIPPNCWLRSMSFDNCTSLSNVTLGTGCTIEDQTFRNCSSLEQINLNGAISIGNDAFEKCGLTSINIPNTVTFIGYAFCTNCPITSITFEDGDTPLVLSGNSNLYAGGVIKSVSSMNGKTIIFPTRLQELRSRALATDNTINFVFLTTTPPTYTNYNVDICRATIYVPDEAVTAYKTATGWSNLENKIKGISELPS